VGYVIVAPEMERRYCRSFSFLGRQERRRRMHHGLAEASKSNNVRPVELDIAAIMMRRRQFLARVM